MPFINTKIDTMSLTLRPLTPKDANALNSLLSEQSIQSFSEIHAGAFLHQECQATDERKSISQDEKITFGLIRKSDHALIGTCVLFNFKKNCKKANIGYGLAANAWNWGKNYISEALSGFLNFAFDTLHLNQIETEVDPRNTISTKILERLGFHKDNYLTPCCIVPRELVGSEIYGLLREEWLVFKKKYS